MATTTQQAERINLGPIEAYDWGPYVRIDWPSESDPDKEYPVFIVVGRLVLCGCPGFKYYGRCKHGTKALQLWRGHTKAVAEAVRKSA